jgi:DNA-binding LacI/PurR family transcriptional regulator
MGYIAIQMLIRLIDHEPLEDRVRKIPTELVERTSCRPWAGRS